MRIQPILMISSLLMLAASAGYSAEGDNDMQIHYPAGSQQSFKGPETYFTGDVQVDMLFPGNETAHYSGAYVTFQPGARTAWHLHPAGQYMIVTNGVALTGNLPLFATQPSTPSTSTETQALMLPLSETSAMKIRLIVDGRSIVSFCN